MASHDVSKMITTLLTAPTEAVVNANSEQRRIWVNWLKDIRRLVDSTDDAEMKKQIINQHLPLAPIWKLSAQISVGITMRVASVSRKEGEASLGLGLGLLQGSGSFGFMSESSSESVMQAQANYALTNDTEVNITDYLSGLGVNLVAATEVDTAIEKLNVASTPIQEDA